MKVRDRITGQQLTADEAYERFFDGFFNLGRPTEALQGTMVMAPLGHSPASPSERHGPATHSRRPRRRVRRAAGHK